MRSSNEEGFLTVVPFLYKALLHFMILEVYWCNNHDFGLEMNPASVFASSFCLKHTAIDLFITRINIYIQPLQRHRLALLSLGGFAHLSLVFANLTKVLFASYHF